MIHCILSLLLRFHWPELDTWLTQFQEEVGWEVLSSMCLEGGEAEMAEQQ